MSILPCEQPIGRKTYRSGLLHLQKLTVLKFISTTYLFRHKLCANTICIRAPLDTWKRWTFRSFAGSEAEVWVDLGRRVSRTGEVLRRSAPPSQQCGQQAAANHGTAPSAAFYYAFSMEASSKQPENNLWNSSELELVNCEFQLNWRKRRFISYGMSSLQYFFARLQLPDLLVKCCILWLGQIKLDSEQKSKLAFSSCNPGVADIQQTIVVVHGI